MTPDLSRAERSSYILKCFPDDYLFLQPTRGLIELSIGEFRGLLL